MRKKYYFFFINLTVDISILLIDNDAFFPLIEEYMQ